MAKWESSWCPQSSSGRDFKTISLPCQQYAIYRPYNLDRKRRSRRLFELRPRAIWLSSFYDNNNLIDRLTSHYYFFPRFPFCQRFGLYRNGGRAFDSDFFAEKTSDRSSSDVWICHSIFLSEHSCGQLAKLVVGWNRNRASCNAGICCSPSLSKHSSEQFSIAPWNGNSTKHNFEQSAKHYFDKCEL